MRQAHGAGAWASIVAAVAQCPTRMATMLQDARARAVLRVELDLLDEHSKLDPILSEIGLSRRGIPTLIDAAPGASRRFVGMTRRLGIEDVAEPDHPTGGLVRILGSQRKCLFCRAARQCETWLRSGALDDEYRAFCPNSRTFERLRVAKQSQPA